MCRGGLSVYAPGGGGGGGSEVGERCGVGDIPSGAWPVELGRRPSSAGPRFMGGSLGPYGGYG
jgi:hypothetical protein